MADMSGEQMQAKITSARREAEGLKDRIKRRKDDLADTSREAPFSLQTPFNLHSTMHPPNVVCPLLFYTLDIITTTHF